MTLPLIIAPNDPGHIDDHQEIHTLLGRLDGQSTFLAAGSTTGALGSRPAASASNLGSFYFAASVPSLAFSDGAVWREQALTSAANTFTATNHFTGDVFFGSGAPWYDVRSTAFAGGAVGDGVANDAPAIQAAATAANADGGGVVFLPLGIYLITTAITLAPKVAVIGVSAIGSSIRVSGAIKGLVYEPGTLTQANITLMDFQILGTTAAALELISFKNCANIYMARINPRNTSTSNIKLDTCYHFDIVDSRIESAVTNGVYLVSCNAWHLGQLDFQANASSTASFIRAETCGYGSIDEGSNFEGSAVGSVGVRLIGCVDIAITDNYFEQLDGPCVRAETTLCQNIWILRNHLHSDDSTWIDFSPNSVVHQSIVVSGNVVDSSFAAPKYVFNPGSASTWEYTHNPIPAGNHIVGYPTVPDMKYGLDYITTFDVWARHGAATEVVMGARGPGGQAGFRLGGSGGVHWIVGSNTPEGAVTANIGSVFLRSNGGANTTLYIKESGVGNTGWVAK